MDGSLTERWDAAPAACSLTLLMVTEAVFATLPDLLDGAAVEGAPPPEVGAFDGLLPSLLPPLPPLLPLFPFPDLDAVGNPVGRAVPPEAIGAIDGFPVGLVDGSAVGSGVGAFEGDMVGLAVGSSVGSSLGDPVGDIVGDGVGRGDGMLDVLGAVLVDGDGEGISELLGAVLVDGDSEGGSESVTEAHSAGRDAWSILFAHSPSILQQLSIPEGMFPDGDAVK